MPRYYKGADAEAEGKKKVVGGDFQGAAEAFDLAAELYAKEGDNAKEDEMRTQVGVVLFNLPPEKLDELGKGAAKAAEQVEKEADGKVRSGKNEGPGGSTEILQTAARRRLEAAERFSAKALRYIAVKSDAKAAAAFAQCAKEYEAAAEDLEKAGRNEPEKDADEKHWDYRQAWLMRQKAIEGHSDASKYYRSAGNAGAAKKEYDAVGDQADKQEKIDDAEE